MIVLMFWRFCQPNTIRAVSLDPVHCKLHDVVIPTDPENHLLLPYYVRLSRCKGADSMTPTHKTCEANSSTSKYINATLRGVNGGKISYKLLLNHTECLFTCKQKNCTKFQTWNNDKCSCACNKATKGQCRQPKVWRGDLCCVCPNKDSCDSNQLDTNCNCIIQRNVEKVCDGSASLLDSAHIVLLVVFEAIGVAIICFMIYRCYQKRKNTQQDEGIPLSEN